MCPGLWEPVGAPVQQQSLRSWLPCGSAATAPQAVALLLWDTTCEISFCEDGFFEPTMDSDCSNSDQAGDCGGFEWPSFSLGCLLQDTSAAILSALPTKHVFDALEATDTKMSVFYVCLCNFRRSLDCPCCRHVIWHYDTNVVITATSLGQQCSGLSFPRPTVLCLVSQLHWHTVLCLTAIVHFSPGGSFEFVSVSACYRFGTEGNSPCV